MRRLIIFTLFLITVSSVYIAVRLTRYLDNPMGTGTKSVQIAPGSSYRQAVTALQHAGIVTDWTMPLVAPEHEAPTIATT